MIITLQCTGIDSNVVTKMAWEVRRLYPGAGIGCDTTGGTASYLRRFGNGANFVVAARARIFHGSEVSPVGLDMIGESLRKVYEDHLNGLPEMDEVAEEPTIKPELFIEFVELEN